MKIELSPRLRLLVLGGVVILVGLAGLLFLRSRGSSSATPAPVAPVHPLHPGRPLHLHRPLHGPVHHVNPLQPGQQPLPREIAAALATGRIVVVLLYDPRVKLDQAAFLEASAGADLAHASFTAVDVSTSDVDVLSTRYAVLHDPSILVLKSKAATLVVKIDGFVDRDTVAQAAAAAS